MNKKFAAKIFFKNSTRMRMSPQCLVCGWKSLPENQFNAHFMLILEGGDRQRFNMLMEEVTERNEAEEKPELLLI